MSQDSKRTRRGVLGLSVAVMILALALLVSGVWRHNGSGPHSPVPEAPGATTTTTATSTTTILEPPVTAKDGQAPVIVVMPGQGPIILTAPDGSSSTTTVPRTTSTSSSSTTSTTVKPLLPLPLPLLPSRP